MFDLFCVLLKLINFNFMLGVSHFKRQMPHNFSQMLLFGAFYALLMQVHRVSTLDCGAVNFVRPTMLGGSRAIKGEWPFIAAIYNQSNYNCGGTIISYRHILTAAHCIQPKKSENPLLPHYVTLRLGAYNLTKNNENEAIQRNVSEIFVHPDWDAFQGKFDADIAILVLSENITFTDNIQPVCMPSNEFAENMEGAVVGYGVRKNTVYAEIPSRISVQVVNSSHCFREDDVLRYFSSGRTFCGGNGDGSPDLGDSGSGYFFTRGFSWAQYGIVSAIRTNDTGHAIPHAYHVYTNLTMFKDWIIKTVNETGGEVGEARISITMNCDYEYKEITSNILDYCCSWRDIDIQGHNFETGSFHGVHLNGKSKHDVEGIHLVDGTMSYLPSGLGLYFKNVKHLIVGENTSLGTKAVRRSDLRSLRALEGLVFRRNEIEILHEDALFDLPKLRVIEFIGNKLQILFNDTFSRNANLVAVDFSSNQLHFLPAHLFRNNPLLNMVAFDQNFLKTIDENCFKIHRRIKHVSFDHNQLEMLPKRLFRNALSLMVVGVNNNSLSSVDEDLFETNVHLTEIFFASNRIESLPPKLFRNNLRLSKVNFAKNSITTIDENLFASNEELYTVTFSGNKLEHLPRNLFKSASMLKILDLSNNRLKDIPIDFTEWQQIEFINLIQNHCTNMWYYREYTAKSSENIENFHKNVAQVFNLLPHIVRNLVRVTNTTGLGIMI